MGPHAVPNCNHLKFFKINLRIPKSPPIQPTSFGQFLRKLRLERQLQQRDLAKKDRVLPGKESIIKLTMVFQVDGTAFNELIVE